MDLTLDVEDYKLNIRTAGLILHNNKVLTHRDVRKDHYCLPGGRVELGESSDKTIKREMEEELGKEIEIIEYVSTIENFFEMEDKKYHEKIGLVSKSYKLHEEVVTAFSKACEERGVSLGPTLEKLMMQFISEETPEP